MILKERSGVPSAFASFLEYKQKFEFMSMSMF